MNFNKELFSKRLKELREEKGLYQKDLAKKVGIAQSVVARYETGTARPGIDTLMQLAIALETTTDYLLGLVDFE